MTNAAQVRAPIVGSVIELASVGTLVDAGERVAVIESMKMHHPVATPAPGRVSAVHARVGQVVKVGDRLLSVDVDASVAPAAPASPDPGDRADRVPPALTEVRDRRRFGLDEERPEAVARRHATGRRTARENLADLVDPGSFVEYGPLVIAAQRRRRSKDELITKTPADGLVGGVAEVHGRRCVVMSYDYLVLAGTQGYQNHRKKDRLFDLAMRMDLPVVILAEGGGGRPGDTDGVTVAGLDCLAFGLLARLAARVPVVGVNTGYCFAGNAALFGMSDIRIATTDSYLGMAGPAMIEGGGLGVVAPTEIGPVGDQAANGVLDIVVADDAEAMSCARTVLEFLAPAGRSFGRPDPDELRLAVPADRRELYPMRQVLHGLVDLDSLLELRARHAPNMITALGRFEGRPLAVVANDAAHLGGAIDSAAARSAARMLRLAEKWRLPVVFVCDTPGFMVGPEAERTGLVEAAGDLFVANGALTVPYLTIVTRKGYGLGAQAMAGGGFKFPVATVGWPTSEFGGMGLEGFVRLGYRDELAAIEDDAERNARFEEMVAAMYEHGRGLSMADHFEIDDVIDPAESERWIRLLWSPAAEPGQHGPAGPWQGG